MANEIQVRESITVRKTDADDPSIVQVQYNPQPTFFFADLAGDSGPYVGTIVVQQTYTVVNLDEYQVAPGGMVRFDNQDADNRVYIGLYVQEINAFVSLHMLLPGEFYRARLSDLLGQDQDVVTGPGTGAATPVYLALKASAAALKVHVAIFPP